MTAPHPLPLLTRVRNYGEQYPEAMRGTATIVEARTSSVGGHEYLVQRDAPIFEGLPNSPAWWASHMVCPALA